MYHAYRVKITIIVGILIFISLINTTYESLKASLYFPASSLNSMLSCVEPENV